MINVQVNKTYANLENFEILRETAEAVLNHHDHPEPAEITIVIEENSLLQQLNLQFLGVDAPTDVLSFGAEEIDPENNQIYLGDIVISMPLAQAQASVSGHSTIAELQLLVVHGALHLLGYDHATDEEKEAMWTAQKEILLMLNCPLAKFPD